METPARDFTSDNVATIAIVRVAEYKIWFGVVPGMLRAIPALRIELFTGREALDREAERQSWTVRIGFGDSETPSHAISLDKKALKS